MSAARICPECGAALRADAPKGFCPACLVRVGRAYSPTDSPRVAGQLLDLPCRFGPYELLEEIARGGMGVVYKARQVALDHLVAVKMILSGAFASREFVQRFQAEAETVARLRHPNIVAIHEVGEHDGQPYFSMDYIAGRSLAELVREHPLPATQAARYLRTIAHAVRHAHEHGILHRDLKPANILIDADDEPRVTDFGLAKRLTSDPQLSTLNPQLTLTGQMLGSPSYSPPEQVGGRHTEISPASDIYSLGAILYHLLVGRPPFAAGTLETTLAQVLNAEPVSPRVLNPSVPRDLETVCLKCLEKEPARRYRTAQELADELDRFQRDEPIRARPVSGPEKLWRWCRRKPQIAGMGVALVIAVASGFEGVLWQLRHAQRSELLARKNESMARQNELRARQTAYVSEMNLAQHAIAANNMGRAWELVHRNRPQRGPAQVDLRRWEWRYLWSLCRSDAMFHLGVQSNGVRAVAVSPDGKVLGISDWDGTIKLRDASTHQEIAARHHAGLVVALAFSPDGTWLASGGESVRLWRAGSWEAEPAPLTTNTVRAMTFSPEGRLLAVSSTTAVRIWDMATRKMVVSLPGSETTSYHQGPVCFSSDGRFFAVGDMDGHFRIFAVASWKQIRSVAASSDGISALAFSPDGRVLASGAAYADSTVRLWETETGRPIGQLKGHGSWVSTVLFSPDGKTLASGCADRTIRLWRLSDLSLLQSYHGHHHEVWTMAFEPNGKRLISGSKDGEVLVWATNGKTPEEPLHTVPGIAALRYSPDGRAMATANRDGTVTLWDVATLQASRTLGASGASNVSVLFSPRSDYLVVGDAAGKVKVWNLAGGHEKAAFVAHAKAAILLGFLEGGKLLATTDAHQQLKIWSTAAWREIRSLALQTNGCHVADLDLHWWQHGLAAIAPGEKSVLLPGSPSDIILFPFDGLSQPMAFKAHRQMVACLRFSIEGRLLASSSWDGVVNLWDWPSCRHHARLSGHLLGVNSVAFSPDGSRIASASFGKEAVKLWDVATLQEIATLTGQGTHFRYVTFSPDGNTLMALNHEGVAHFWRAPSWEQIHAAEEVRDSDAF